jgi:hypothetical protein
MDGMREGNERTAAPFLDRLKKPNIQRLNE